ncbi:MAG: carbohydrate-binding protein, partial [Gloeobacteraceae cyanobacterium ES-bin-316]|nr:carbohydrate-binding protein [Ferruginibacter sp.]
IPFKQHRIAGSAIIPAVDYDLGRNGVAYFDRDTANYWVAGLPGVGNKGRIYRNDGVDIRLDSSEKESYYVSDFEKGEWLQFSVEVLKKGTYNIKLELASDTANSKFGLHLINKVVATKIEVPEKSKTGKWQVQQINNMALDAGQNVMRIYAEEGRFSFKSIRVLKIN